MKYVRAKIFYGMTFFKENRDMSRRVKEGGACVCF